jgi:hypothetical protein
MARPVQHPLVTTAAREKEELACTAGLNVKRASALPGDALAEDMRTRQFLLPIRA